MKVRQMDKHKIGPALGRVPSGIFIVTARQAHDETGMLGSWVQQAGFEPPMITVAVKKGRYITDWLAEGSYFVVNILSEDEKQMLAHFGKGFAQGEPAFEELVIHRSAQGVPVLSEALGYLECKVTARMESGDHILIVAEVKDGVLQNEGRPMIHVRNNGFHY